MSRLTLPITILVFLTATHLRAEDRSLEFFEEKIRPLLAERCYSCHSADAEELEAGLYLDRREGLVKGGDSGAAIVPGSPDTSLLIRAVRYEENEMPPDRKLSDEEINALEKWVEMGAPWPAEEVSQAVVVSSGYDWNKFRNEHWSFRPLSKPDLPAIKASDWAQNEIDLLIQAGHESNGLKTAQPASPVIMVRRIYFDLIGIPPTPEQVDEFQQAMEADPNSAVSSLVDELLMSPHYGERWGRHWLDVARYSDGHGGFLDNRSHPHAWRYRDWVVAAFNEDLPYDEFVRLQIAGDILKGHEAVVATGFFALGPTYQSDGGDPDSVAQANSETLDDRMDTMSRGLLGLTVSCARCHDHKFDPIPQADYYSLAAIFNNSNVREAPLAPEEEVRTFHQHQENIKSTENRIKEKREAAKKEERELSPEESAELESWEQELKQLRESAPAPFATAHALHDSGNGNMRIALRGNPRRHGDEVPRRFLEILTEVDARPEFQEGSGRLELSQAISSPENPLTARVIVNRIWMHHFGKAIVRSPSNFGVLGDLPTHPELLDYLAITLIESGWSIKALHRHIMNSATYQMSSSHDEQNFGIDGDNQFVWRMNPRRMDVEVWRDSLLSVTDEIDLSIGGAPFDNLANTNRRTLYAKVSRNGDVFASDTFLRLFYFPLMRATVAKRPFSVVPQQFLFMMNSQFMIDRAQALANRLEQASTDREEQIQLAYRLLFNREANPEEMKLGQAFIAEQESFELKPLVQYAQVLLSSNEFMFIR